MLWLTINADNSRPIVEAFRKLGFKVDEANSTEETLEKIDTSTYGLSSLMQPAEKGEIDPTQRGYT
jgi:hypothetical protein